MGRLCLTFFLAEAACLFISLFGFSVNASKGLKMCVCPQGMLWSVLHSMAGHWELDHHTS